MSVLLLGPTGTGKELLAQAVHTVSGRRAEFVPINCAALAPELSQSELFGHTRGAFSGATAERQGAFRASHGGTLFLDEVADAPPQVQVALLRAIETNSVRPVGAEKEVKVNLRVVAATSRNLQHCVANGTFRQDLYFRLAGHEFHVPSLAERREDLAQLAGELLRQLEHPGQLNASALDYIQSQPWPGNVRELRSALQRAAIRAGKAQPIGSEHMTGASGIWAIEGVEQLAPEVEARGWLGALFSLEDEGRALEAYSSSGLRTSSGVSRRSQRTEERALLLCLLARTPLQEFPAHLRTRFGRLFHPGWYLAEEGRSLKRLAAKLKVPAEEQRLVEAIKALTP